MTADLVARLLACADEVEQHPHPSHCDHLHVAHKLLREAASALRSSGEAVGHILSRDVAELAAGDTGTLWPAPSESVDTITGRRDHTVPVYLHPATPASAWRPPEFDGTDAEVLREFIRVCREVKPIGQWPGERVCAAIERAMANEKPFRFIAESDMAPERGHNGRGGDADRAYSGPRRPPASTQKG